MMIDSADSAGDGRTGVRKEQIRQSAEAGRRRFEAEAELKEKLKRRKEEEETRRKEALTRSEKAKEESGERRKAWAVGEKQRTKELAEFQKRQADERGRYERMKAAKQEKVRKQNAYMKGLHDASAAKFEREKLKQMEKDQKAKMRTDSEREHRLAVERLNRKEAQEREKIEAEARAKLAVIDDHGRKLLYPVSQWLQMKLREHEQWLRSERAKPAVFAVDLDRQARERRQKIDKEYAHRTQQIESQIQTEKAAATREREAALVKLDEGIRIERATHDRLLRQKLEDAER